MNERPRKLTPICTLVVWGARDLTLGEAVVWYHDWALDQGGADGSYISHESLSQRLGGKLTAATISKVRQRLKRLTLHQTLPRRDARNVGWVATLPLHCQPHNYRDVPTMATALDQYLRGLVEWQDRGRDGPDSLDPRVQTAQTPRSTGRAAALGGRGGDSLLASRGETQLPSDFREKGVGAHAPETTEGSALAAERSTPDLDDGLTEEERWERLRATRRRQIDDLRREKQA